MGCPVGPTPASLRERPMPAARRARMPDLLCDSHLHSSQQNCYREEGTGLLPAVPKALRRTPEDSFLPGVGPDSPTPSWGQTKRPPETLGSLALRCPHNCPVTAHSGKQPALDAPVLRAALLIPTTGPEPEAVRWQHMVSTTARQISLERPFLFLRLLPGVSQFARRGLKADRACISFPLGPEGA